jgi:hypothetical protein
LRISALEQLVATQGQTIATMSGRLDEIIDPVRWEGGVALRAPGGIQYNVGDQNVRVRYNASPGTPRHGDVLLVPRG